MRTGNPIPMHISTWHHITSDIPALCNDAHSQVLQVSGALVSRVIWLRYEGRRTTCYGISGLCRFVKVR